MKLSIILLFLLISLTPSLSAQTTDTYDIATFTPPAGWGKKTKEGAVLFAIADEKKGTFCMLTIYASGPGSGDPRRDFENDWQEFIAAQLKVTGKPEIETAKTPGGWDSVIGAVEFKNDLGPSIVVMNTFSGFGKSFSLAAVFNDQGYLPAIESFIASLTLETPAANNSRAPLPGASDISIVGTWGISQSAQNNFAVNHGIAGNITKQYTFAANGTYQFIVKNFQYTMANLLFKKETGTYQLSGNSLTLVPQKGYIQAWTKATIIDSTGKPATTDKWGKLVSTQSTKLERVTYQVSKQYFSGIQEWQIVMQTSNPTERDGPFTGNSSFPNSYLYGTPCSQCMIEQPK